MVNEGYDTLDGRNIEVMLDEDTIYKLIELTGMFKFDKMNDCIKEIIKRSYLRETNDRSWKSRVADRRKLLKEEMDDIERKIKDLQAKGWIKFLKMGAIHSLKLKRKMLQERLEEQMKIYRLVAKID